ncbi:hypothetical protein TSUD_243880 [Trifolium subterraneum]|uniref:Deoxyhypusine synthase n=1 Tax=Trifolium subterraneum TaxID=3900 RepID=A0A2Z6PRM6_TRISU|nr:hypothetical protein TSUD_243880 [Trifolium subterraneum]
MNPSSGLCSHSRLSIALLSGGKPDKICSISAAEVHAIVTTTGGIEEDLIKCLAPTYKGDFSLPGAYLRSKGLNRIGNLLVPNDNYCKFEDWIIPIFDQMLKEQNNENVLWTPSKLIARLGKEINNESSYLYWAYKNNIPVYCPGLTDGSLGDMLYFHSFHNPGLIVDIVQDIRAMNGEAVHANPRKTGMIILGGGLPKQRQYDAQWDVNGAGNVRRKFPRSPPRSACGGVFASIPVDGKKIPVFGAPNRAIPAGIRSDGCKLTS